MASAGCCAYRACLVFVFLEGIFLHRSNEMYLQKRSKLPDPEGSCELHMSKNTSVLEEGRPVRFTCHTGPRCHAHILWFLNGTAPGTGVSPVAPSANGSRFESTLSMVPRRDQSGLVLQCRLLFDKSFDQVETSFILDIIYPPRHVAVTGSATNCNDTSCDVALSSGRTYGFTCQSVASEPACRFSWTLTGPDGSGDDLPADRTTAVRGAQAPSPRGGWNASSEVRLKVQPGYRTRRLACFVWHPDNETLFREIGLVLNIDVHTPSAGPNRTRILMIAGIGLFVLAMSCSVVYGASYLHRRIKQSRRRERSCSTRACPGDRQNAYPMRPVGSDDPDEPGSCVRSFPRDRLDLLHVVGEGSFGLVYKATADGITVEGRSETVAVKTLKGCTSSCNLTNFQKELDVCMSLGRHPHVITMLGFCTEEEPFLLIFEFASNGNLNSFLRKRREEWMSSTATGPPVSSAQIVKFAYQIASGMEHLASIDIIHRDLAARNILLGEGLECKLSDFGFARDVVMEDFYSMTSNDAVPVRWMAIESITENTYTTKSDVWSFGVLLWELVTMGSHPYGGVAVKNVITFLKKGKRLAKPPHCSDELYEVMKKCWSPVGSQRPEFGALELTLRSMFNQATKYLQMSNFTPNTVVVTSRDC